MTVRRHAPRLAILAVLAACGTGSEDLREIRDGQREIRAKLAEIEKKIDQMATRPAPAAARPDPNRIYNLPTGNSPFKGPADAPVTFIEFSDFQCPFCARVSALVDQVLKAYPNEVKFVYKELPLRIHPDAMNASRAGLAAHRQGKFWEMHDKMFANQRALDPESLKKYAREIGLDMARFEADMNSPEVQKQIDEDVRLAQASQVTGTPTLFINGKRVVNRSFEGIKAMIEEALKKSAGPAKAEGQVQNVESNN